MATSRVVPTVPLIGQPAVKTQFHTNWGFIRDDHNLLDARITTLEGSPGGNGGVDFGSNTIVVSEQAGATPGAKLAAALALVGTSSPGSYRVLVTNSGVEYMNTQQLVIPTHGGHTTEVMGWGMPVIRRNDLNTAREVFFASGPGTVHITGIDGKSNSGEGTGVGGEPPPGAGFFLIPSGTLKAARITHCRFVDIPKTYIINCSRGGVEEITMSHNYFENIGGGGHLVAGDVTNGLGFDTVEISHNVCVNVRTELFSADRGNFGSHGPVQNKNIRIVGNRWTLTPSFTLVGKNSVFACSCSENVLIADNVIEGCQASVFRLEDVAQQFVISNNVVNRMINWPLATAGEARYYEFSGVHLMDCFNGSIIGNIFRDMIYAGISVENNVEKGRAKRIIIAANHIIGSGYAGISIEGGPDVPPTSTSPGHLTNVIDIPTKILQPYDDMAFYIGGNMVGHITKTIAQTGQRTLANCGRGIVLNADYDIRWTGANKFYECDGPAVWEVGRPLLNSSPIGPIDHTCLTEFELSAPLFRGTRFKNDSARGKTTIGAVTAGFAGWIDLMDLGSMARGILDIGFMGPDGNNHFAYLITEVNHVGVGPTLVHTPLRANKTGPYGDVEVQVVGNRTLQARVSSTSTLGTTVAWSVDFQGERWLESSPPAINRCKEYKMLYAGFDGTNDWLGPNAMTLGTAAVAEQLIPRTIGVPFGDMNGGLGEQAAFDGVTNNSNGTCAQKAGAANVTFAYIGKAYHEKHIFSKAVVHGSNNAGFWSSAEPPSTIEIYGKVGMPGDDNDGTLIGSLAFTDTANQSAGQTVTSTDLVNGYTHIWARLSHNVAAGNLTCNVRQLVLHDQSATASKQLFWSAWFAPTLETWAANMPIVHIGPASAPIFRLALTSTGRIEVVCAGGAVAVRSVTGVNLNNATGLTFGRMYHLTGSIDSAATPSPTFWLAANRLSILDTAGAQSFCPANATLIQDGANGAIGWVPETADQGAAPAKYNGVLGDVFISAQYVPDIATAAAYTEGLYREPYYLAEDGIGIAGGLAPPRIFLSAGMSRNSLVYHTNRGTAGGFTLNGVM